MPVGTKKTADVAASKADPVKAKVPIDSIMHQAGFGRSTRPTPKSDERAPFGTPSGEDCSSVAGPDRSRQEQPYPVIGRVPPNCSVKGQSKISTLERPDRHESRRKRPFSPESSGSLGYDRGLRYDKWKNPGDRAISALNRRIRNRRGGTEPGPDPKCLLVTGGSISCHRE